MSRDHDNEFIVVQIPEPWDWEKEAVKIPEPWEREKEAASRKVNLKTTVHNRTQIPLTFRNFVKYRSYGTIEMVVPAGGVKRIRSGKFIRESPFKPFDQDVRVLDGNRRLLVLCLDDFEDNEGKELVLEMADGRLHHRFVDLMHKPTISRRIWDALDPIVEPIETLWYRLSVGSPAVLKQTWLRSFVSGWKSGRVWERVSSCLFWLAYTFVYVLVLCILLKFTQPKCRGSIY